MKQIFYILLILCVFGLFGCSEQPEPKKTVVSIEVIDATVPEKILIAELDEKYKLDAESIANKILSKEG